MTAPLPGEPLAASMAAPWHSLALAELARSLETDPARGLTSDEAARRLAQLGPNELRRAKPISPIAIFAQQFRSLVVWLLVGAGLVSGALGEWVDGLAILAIVGLNAAIGFFQEFRAERAVAALASLSRS